MHYVRFLKTPNVHVEHGSVLLRAVLTVTTDLGETFYPSALELVVTLRSLADDGDIYLRRKVQWPAGARAVPVSLDISRQDIEWPACMHAAVKGGSGSNAHADTLHNFLPPFVDVWSGLLNPIKGQFDSGRRVERRFVSVNERPLALYEDAGDSIARHLWDGSQALAQHIDQVISLNNPTACLPLLEYVLVSATYRRLNVLELGCGCGTVGLSLAQSIPDCDVLLTDLEEVTSLVEANIARLRPAMASRARFQPLDWLTVAAGGTAAFPPKLQSRTHDLIIVSECTYNADSLHALVSTILSLLVRSPKAVVVVATKTRHDSEAEFFTLMRNAGVIAEGNIRLKLPGEPGTGYADSATDIGLHLFRGREHRLSLSPRNRSEEDVPTVEASKTNQSR